MFIRIFRTTQPLPLLVLGLISAVLWTISWIFTFRVHPSDGMPLYDLTCYLLFQLPGWTLALTGFLLTTSQAIHLNHVLNKHDILYKSSWLPALLYVVLGGLFPAFLGFHPLLFVNTIFIFALDKLITLYKHSSPLPLAFDSALLFSIAALFYLPVVAFFIFYVIAILILRPLNWQDATAGITGLFLPFFFAFLYYFLTDRLMPFYERIFLSGITTSLTTEHLSTGPFLYSVLFVLILLVLSIMRLQGNYYKNVTKARLVQQMLMMFIPFGLLTVIISKNDDLSRYMILVIPFSVYLGYYFLSASKKILAELTFLALLIALGVNYYLF
jgi:hypothetical protein